MRNQVHVGRAETTALMISAIKFPNLVKYFQNYDLKTMETMKLVTCLKCMIQLHHVLQGNEVVSF